MEPTKDNAPVTTTSHAVEAKRALQHPRLWQPNLTAFISSGCMMVLELVAGRIIAPYVGVSLYTWTSVIGVVLAGISLGNYTGGRLADRWASLRLLGGIFLLGGLASFGILAVDKLGRQIPSGWPVVAGILMITAALFFLPCFILGMVSPILAKLAVRDLAKIGNTVGKIYAFGTVGSIVGTFATGFVLISWFGTHTIVWGVALVLLALGILFLVGGHWQVLLAAAVLFAGGSLLASKRGWLRGPCVRETNYFCIKVHEETRDGEEVRVLVLDRLVHSYSSLSDPTKLVYGYEQIYARVTAYRAQQDKHLRALFIGGGGYTFPRYIEAVYPGSDIEVVEIDPGVTQIAHERLGLRQDTMVVTYNEDARLFLGREPTSKFDLIFGDAFNDFSVPYHLTTKEFNDRVRGWLEEDGLYVVNIVDGAPGDFLRAFANTLGKTFRYAYLASGVRSFKNLPRSTFVFIATDAPLKLEDKIPEEGYDKPLVASQVLTGGEFEELLASGRVVTLTDQYAPVDQMLAWAFRY